MPTTAGEVADDAAALLNDAGKSVFSDIVLLPYINKAYLELQTRLTRLGAADVNEIYAPDQTVNAGGLVLPSPPADMIEPVKLYERAVGGTDDDWIPMTQMLWEPTETKQTYLRYWIWREQAVAFLGATTNRQVRLYYKKAFPVLSGESSNILVNDARPFLASRSAAIAAMAVWQNYELAQVLDSDAEKAFDTLSATDAKQRQSLPVRRRRYMPRR